MMALYVLFQLLPLLESQNQNKNQSDQQEVMLKEKTNQDYNKQKPDPKDPNQNKNRGMLEVEDTDNKNEPITANSKNNASDLVSNENGKKGPPGNNKPWPKDTPNSVNLDENIVNKQIESKSNVSNKKSENGEVKQHSNPVKDEDKNKNYSKGRL